MKTLDVSQATGELSSYAEHVRKEPLVVTDQGKPVMALVSIENADMETVTLSTDSRFIALIERSRTRYKAGAGIPLAEIRRRYRLAPKPGRKTTRKVTRKARSSSRR